MLILIQKARIYKVDEFGVKNYHEGFLIGLAIIVLYACMSSAAWLMLQYELTSAEANITTFADALWTLQSTVSTVGYGDFYPITTGGRITATAMLYIGFGLIGFIATKVVRLIMGFSNTDVRNRELRKQNAEIIERNKMLERKVDTLVQSLAKLTEQK